MKKEIKTVRTKKGVKKYTYLGCPLTRNRSAWCYRLCTPDGEGHGRCGRVAPHSIKSRIQLAIEKYNKKQQKIHFEKMENMYLSHAGGEDSDPGIRIAEGNTEIVLSVPRKSDDKTRGIDGSFFFKAMTDASLYAVNSLIDDALLVMVNFNTYLTHPAHTGEFIVKGRFVGASGDHFLAEAIITDAGGNEIARGNGAFMKSDTPLSAAIGYE
jgi:acyl-coenzyme A thioesterase PaaI-like protein